VTWSIFASDPNAELSQRGMPQKAPGLFKYGHEQITAQSSLHGGLSQYCILRPHTIVVKVGESIPLPVVATVNCAGATVAGALRLAGDVKGKRIMISGVGMLGLYACAMSQARGAKWILALDANPARLDLARQFGAQETHLASSQAPASEELVDIVIELSGRSEAMETALDRMDIGATAVWVGATHPQAPVRVDAERIIRRLNTIKGLHNYNAQDLLQAVEFVEQHHQRFPFIELISDRFTLDQAQEAFAFALSSDCHRVGLRIGV
jgi:alcohol dehydrogenase